MEILQPSWRGRSINSRKDTNGRKYTAMVGPKSLLYIPVNVLPNAIYKVTLELCKESGNGILYCNLYGNRNFDFHHSKITCESGNWTTFDVDVVTKNFPKTVPIVFRLWRGKEGTGSMLVRRIIVRLEKGPIEKPNTTGKIIGINEGGPACPNPLEMIDKILPTKQHKKRHKLIKSDKKHIIMPDVPKIFPIKVGENNIKVSVIVSIYNRKDFFNRSLKQYVAQTMPLDEFELVVVDDNSTHNIEKLCKKYANEYGLQIIYIKMDKNKGSIPPETFTPALSTNLGFKNARGSVVAITGPETLMNEKTVENSWKEANEGVAVYGYIYKSNIEFIKSLEKNALWKNLSFDQMLDIAGAKYQEDNNVGWWWYYVALRKEHVFAIGGVDERFGLGVTAEDDNFALRLMAYGLPLKRKKSIMGIHQNHSIEDKKDIHEFRFNKKKWRYFRQHNIKLLNDWYITKDPIANKNIEWGSINAIKKREYYK